MAINKSQAPTWVKIVIIVVVVAFVSSVVAIGAAPLFTPKSNQVVPTNSATGVDAINAKYGPTAQALQQAVASQPESYTALVSLGNTYMDWASELQQGGTTATATAALPLWTSARDAYGKALAVKPGESPVEGDYAITIYNLGDAKLAIKRAEALLKRDPKFAIMWFQIGNFYYTDGQKDKATKAFEEYLKLEPNGQLKTQAEQALQQIKSGQ